MPPIHNAIVVDSGIQVVGRRTVGLYSSFQHVWRHIQPLCVHGTCVCVCVCVGGGGGGGGGGGDCGHPNSDLTAKNALWLLNEFDHLQVRVYIYMYLKGHCLQVIKKSDHEPTSTAGEGLGDLVMCDDVG